MSALARTWTNRPSYGWLRAEVIALSLCGWVLCRSEAAAATTTPDAPIPPNTGEITTTPAAPASATAPVGPRPSVEMNQEIADAFAAERIALTQLQTRFHNATSETDALAIQQQIDVLKQVTEIQILRIQVRYARQAGYTSTADEMDAVIAQLIATRAQGAAAPAPPAIAPGGQK